jgi:hypothetical protein
MVVRLVRAGVGALLLLIAVPLALAGGGLWLAMEHRAADDTFTARLERVRTDGTALVVSDVDALLRADAPFARGGQTTLSLSAVGSGGPLFVGLGPEEDVRRYLDGLAQSRLTRVRLARGPLPVELTARPARPAPVDASGVAIAAAPLPVPAGQLFWLARSTGTAGVAQLTWSPSAMRGRHLALVIMKADGTAGVDAILTARLAPAWLGPTTGGLMMLGTALFLLALITLAWPPARRAEPQPAPEPEALPLLPAQPTSAARGRGLLRRNLSAPRDALASMINPSPPAEPETPAPADDDRASEPVLRPDPPRVPSEAVLATLADVLAAADREAAIVTDVTDGDAETPFAHPTPPAEPEVADHDGRQFAECELDRPAPQDADLDDRGPVELPPLPAMPAIELQFTWAPIALDDLDDRDPANTGSTAR